MTYFVVLMGVSGCGKSTIAKPLAMELGCPMVEGDSWHPPENVAKMRAGIPLQDADRAGWLALLADQLEQHPQGVVLTCSALKKMYRDRLRAARVSRLHFAHLTLTPEQAKAHVQQREAHFFNPSLVDSQFATLEPPSVADEPDCRAFDATQPVHVLVQQIAAWVKSSADAAAIPVTSLPAAAVRH